MSDCRFDFCRVCARSRAGRQGGRQARCCKCRIQGRAIGRWALPNPRSCNDDRHGGSMLTLYFAPGASSMAVHIALHEIGVAFEGKPMSFKANDMQSSQFLKLNAAGQVPTLLIDGRPLTEVAGILF